MGGVGMNHKAAINIIAGELGMAREDRQAVSLAVVGVASLTEMSALQLAKVRTHFEGLQARAKGLAAPAGAPVREQRPKPSLEAAPMVRRIRAQLISLGRKPDGYADGVAKQMWGEAAPRYFEWATGTQLKAISMALAAQQAREGAATSREGEAVPRATNTTAA